MELTLHTADLSYCASSDSDLNNIVSLFTIRKKVGNSICNPCTLRMTKNQMLELLDFASWCENYASEESKKDVVEKLITLYTMLNYSDRVKLSFYKKK